MSIDTDTMEVTGNALNTLFAGQSWALIVHDGEACFTMGDKTPGHLLAVLKAAVAQLEAMGVEPAEDFALTYVRGLKGHGQ